MKQSVPSIFLVIILVLPWGMIGHAQPTHQIDTERWTTARATEWSEQYPWIVGFNYVPKSAINQLEMWQQDTFDPTQINQELEWASKIGFNMVRVFLHHIPWMENSEGFYQRIDQFLSIADTHNIDVMFVLFDDVWNPMPKAGIQPSPRKGVHNSGWVQSPGAEILGNLDRHDEMEPYVRGIVSRYSVDDRVAIWDLYNEPGNLNAIPYGHSEVDEKPRFSLALLKKTFAWAREESPSQPLTSGVWRLKKGSWRGASVNDSGAALFNFMLEQSDIITFHSYEDSENTTTAVSYLETLNRPMICTEYVARSHGSNFDTILPLFADKNIGAMHWGFVSGKTQTIYPWRSWVSVIRFWDGLFSDSPNPWHHDLLYSDGTAYDPSEVDLISSLMSKKMSEQAQNSQ